MTREPSRWRCFALGGLWVVVSCAILIAPGCYGRNCDPSFETYGDQPGEGRMLTEDIWESTPVDGTWLWFPRQRYYAITLPLSGRAPQIVLPYLSAQPEPMKTGADFTLGAGNLALVHNALPNRVDIRNDTCSDYYLRLVVITTPLPADAGAPEAGAEGDDGGASDANDPSYDGEEDAQAGP
jgi:hypothetical protein